MKLNIISIISIILLTISASLFFYFVYLTEESRSDQIRFKKSTQNLIVKLPLIKNEIIEEKKQIAINEKNKQIKLQKEEAEKEQLVLEKEKKENARRDYILTHGMTPEEGQARAQARAIKRKNLRIAREARIKQLQQDILSTAAWNPSNTLGERTKAKMISDMRKELHTLLRQR